MPAQTNTLISPLPLLVLDFETYFDREYSLRRLSIPEYVFDPRFKVHGLAIRHPGGGKEFNPDTPQALAKLQDRFGPRLERATVICHNAYFDLFILHHQYGLTVHRFLDTMLLAYHVWGRRDGNGGHAASLGAIAQQYGLTPKSAPTLFRGVRHLNELQLAAMTAYATHDAELTYQAATHLLPLITRPSLELPLMRHTVRLFCERGLRVDLPALHALRAEIQHDTQRWFAAAGASPEELSKDQRFAELLQQALARTGRKLTYKAGKHGDIPATAKTDESMIQLCEDDDPVVAALARARLGKKSEDQLLARLNKTEAIATATRGDLPPHLYYCGARTGRWSGGGGLNLQNIGRDGYGLRIRKLFIPHDGNTFIIGDYAQIEARVLAWLAQQHDLVQAFKEDRDIYCENASEALGCTVRKPTPNDPPDQAKRLKALRQVGKRSVLGLGYAMGALKHANALRSDPLTAPLFDSGVLSLLICRNLVKQYRAKYPEIPKLWHALEAAFLSAMQGKTVECHGLRFKKSGQTVMVTLPSGRALRYPNPQLSDAARANIRFVNGNGEIDEFEPQDPAILYSHNLALYGGKLTENIVQAIARDILAEAILRLETRGRRVILHVHDEIVVETPVQDERVAWEDMQAVMSVVPRWATGLPIACEITKAERYGK